MVLKFSRGRFVFRRSGVLESSVGFRFSISRRRVWREIGLELARVSLVGEVFSWEFYEVFRNRLGLDSLD